MSAETPWIVVRTFNRREKEVAEFLKENHYTHFIPMTLKEKKVMSYDQKPKVVQVPVIHNYIFVQKPENVDALKKQLAEFRFPVNLMHDRGSDRVNEISNKEMVEFRLLCDPSYNNTQQFLEADEADAKPGKEVVIVHGQFAGIRGKLHKKKKEYWFIKTVGGVAVQLRISRWYCKVIHDSGQETPKD